MLTINFNVSDKVIAILGKEAASRGYSRTAFAGMLFEAAYAARFGRDAADFDLKAVIEMVLVLYGVRRDSEEIGRAVGLEEATVERILGEWRNALTVRKAPDMLRDEASAKAEGDARKRMGCDDLLRSIGDEWASLVVLDPRYPQVKND